MSAQRYPLSWPRGWIRTSYGLRKAAPFSKKTTIGDGYPRNQPLDIGDGLARLTGELRRLGASKVTISSNLRIREDGFPYAQQARQLEDPGVAVYFTLEGPPRVLACDRWRSAADNMAAIAGHIEAIRAVDRYGVGSLEQAFAGYVAIGHAAGVDWQLELGVPVDASLDAIEFAYQALARRAHPDAGGSHDAMARLNTARDAARKARS